MFASAIATHARYKAADSRFQVAGTARIAGLERAIEWLLVAFVFVLPTDLRLSGDKSLAMRLGYACLLLGIAGLIKRRTFVLPRNGFWWLLGFVGWMFSSLVWAQYSEAAWHKVLLYMAVFAATAIIPQYAWDVRLRGQLMDAYVAGCALGILGTAANFAMGDPYPELGSMGVDSRYSFGADPNYLALALVIGVPLALHRSGQYTSGWQRKLAWLYVPAVLTAVFLTGSRTGLMAFLVVIVTYACVSGRRALKWIIAGLFLCLTIGVLMPAQISDRFAGIPEELRYGTLSDRRQLWDRGTAIVVRHPLQGIGAGATTGVWDIAAHNTPLELMMEGGLVGVSLFYGALLFGIAGALRRNRPEARAMISAWSAWFVGTLLLSWEINTITWFMFALLFSASSARSGDRAHLPPETGQPIPQGVGD